MMKDETSQTAELLHRALDRIDAVEEEVSRLRLEVSKLRSKPEFASKDEHEDLKGSLQVIWGFFIEPAWSRIEELECLVKEPSDASSYRIYTGEEPDKFSEFPGEKVYPGEEKEGRSVLVRGLPSGMTVEEVRKIYVLQELEFFEGNKTKTARSLGVDIKTLYNSLYRWGLMTQANGGTDADTKRKLKGAAQEGKGRKAKGGKGEEGVEAATKAV